MKSTSFVILNCETVKLANTTLPLFCKLIFFIAQLDNLERAINKKVKIWIAEHVNFFLT